ncbi:uncharacterized protein LOC135846989 [Planococcus citri]|uniref:uncharacterized protein LOC135846989 n=1 Tax=Planococcus citri TaxID=170843 RepID=UPI0031F9E9C6
MSSSDRKLEARRISDDIPSTSRQGMAFHQYRQIPDDQPSTSRQALGIPDYDSDEYETDRRSSSPDIVYVGTKRRRVSGTNLENGTPANIQVNHDRPQSINPPAEEYRVENMQNGFDHFLNGTTSEEAHSDNHQLKILMLMLKYGVEKEYSFAIGTAPDDAAENYDDIVFRYKEPNGKSVYQFLRSKHKKHTNRVITFKDLLTEKDRKFSIQKHFNSFRKILRNPLFQGHELKDYVVCTNISLDRHLHNCFARITTTDEILTFEHGDPQCLKFKYKKFAKRDELISKLIKSSDCDRLARRVAKYVKNGKCFDLKGDLFRTYHRALREYVIKEETVQEKRGRIINAKFHKDFVTGYLPDSAKKFRTAFYDAYQEYLGFAVNEEEFWKNMKHAKLTMSYSFKRYFELNDDPHIMFHELFAKEIADEMSRAKDGIVRIERRPQVIKENIDKLAGYVLITKNDTEEDTYYFSSEFFRNKPLPGNLEDFKNRLKKELHQRDIPFAKDLYKFHIINFKTCNEAVVYSKSQLPDDNGENVSQREIDYFFDKLVFVINQPLGTDLSQIIDRKINKYFNFSHDDIARSFPDHILLWLKSKKGSFQSHREGESFFETMNLLIPNLYTSPSTSRKFIKVESPGKRTLVEFQSGLSDLQRFLISKEMQIFNLISSSQSVKLSAFKVLRIVKNIPTYQTNDKLIFEHLSSILLAPDRVINDFKSETKNNLLMIACEADEEANVWELVFRLYPILEGCRNKKIIIITRENDELAEAFRSIYIKTKKYTEMKDDEGAVGLVDLPEDLQKNILKKGKFIFKIGDVDLDLSSALSEDESLQMLRKIFKGDLLSKLL